MNGKTLNTRHGELTLRTVRPSDAGPLRALRLEALITCPTIFGSVPEELDSINWNDQATNGAGAGDQALFVVERAGELVAVAGVVRNTRPKTKHAAFIWGVYVKPAFRGARLAETMVNACVDWARERGVSIVRLTVVVGNDKAIACYQRCRFETTGTDVAAIRSDGVDYDEYLMSRRV
ncbi:MAG: GNAT family N-acetyltransferase [Chthoniobacterales bacterium]|nr:GNAT family N-acetyltransferase [Chthoniobacterales bacterium]